MTTCVIRVESEACNNQAVYTITVVRDAEPGYTPDVDDLPHDIRQALTNWVAGKLP